MYKSSYSTFSLLLPPPFIEIDSDINATRVTTFQRGAQHDVKLFAVGNDKVKLPLQLKRNKLCSYCKHTFYFEC